MSNIHIKFLLKIKTSILKEKKRHAKIPSFLALNSNKARNRGKVRAKGIALKEALFTVPRNHQC